VESVKSSLKSVASNNSSDVNSKIRATRQKLESAIEYSSKESLLDAILSGKEEGALGTDFNLTSADSELQRELNDINRKISDTEYAINDAKNRISSIKSAIEIEERRQREEAARAAEEARKKAAKQA
jgi:hypothetical protein